MRILLADVVTNLGAVNWNWLALTLDGNVVKNSDGLTFQQLPSGAYKFDHVDNPGDWEICNQSNGQLVWRTGFSRLFVVLP